MKNTKGNNVENAKEQREEMIKEISTYYKKRADFYEAILKFARIEDSKLLELVEIYGVRDLTGVSVPLFREDFTKENSIKYKEMCMKSIRHVDGEAKEMRNLLKKAIYMAELESDEIKQVVIGYYYAICASVLTPFLICRK